MDEAPVKDSKMVPDQSDVDDVMLGKKIIEESAKLMLVLVFYNNFRYPYCMSSDNSTFATANNHPSPKKV